MNTIQGVTDQPKQETSITLSDGSKATLVLEYRPQQLGWFYNIAWGDFAANGLRLVASPNILRGFRKLIPFGIAVITAGAVEPLNQGAFINGTVTLLLLDASDVAAIEDQIYVGS